MEKVSPSEEPVSQLKPPVKEPAPAPVKAAAAKAAPVQNGPPAAQPAPVQAESTMEKPMTAPKQTETPPVSKKPGSATSDPSVIIDYNMLQGD